MADRFSGPDAPLDAVLRRLDEIERRLHQIETQFAAATVMPTAAPAAARPAFARPSVDASSVAALAGRTSLVLAGGYLLRALTASHVLPLTVGVGLGLAYAVFWIVMADRAGASGRIASAIFHGGAAAAVACPLLYEGMVRFHVLDPWTLVVNLTVIAALGLAVGWYRWIQPIAWIFTSAAILTSIALMRVVTDASPVALHLVALAAMTYWLAHARPWWRIRWLAALVADGAVLKVVVDATAPAPHPRLVAAIAVAVLLFGASIASVSARLLALGGEVVPFDIAQSAAALAIGFGGAAYLARTSGLDTFPFAATAMIVGAAAYAVAFAGVLDRKNFQYFALLAIALVIAGGILVFRPGAAAVLWIALAFAATWLGKRLANVMLSAQGTAYLFAAAIASGLLLAAAHGVLGAGVPGPAALAPIALVTLAAVAGCSAISPVSVRTFGATRMASIAGGRRDIRVPRALALALLAVTLSGVAVIWIVPAWHAAARAAAAPGLLATIRTTVLAVTVIVLAVLAGRAQVVEAAWLIYPFLVATGLKILLEDFRQSEPAMLVVTLVVYGLVLIAAPRIAHGTVADA